MSTSVQTSSKENGSEPKKVSSTDSKNSKNGKAKPRGVIPATFNFVTFLAQFEDEKNLASLSMQEFDKKMRCFMATACEDPSFVEYPNTMKLKQWGIMLLKLADKRNEPSHSRWLHAFFTLHTSSTTSKPSSGSYHHEPNPSTPDERDFFMHIISVIKRKLHDSRNNVIISGSSSRKKSNRAGKSSAKKSEKLADSSKQNSEKSDKDVNPLASKKANRPQKKSTNDADMSDGDEDSDDSTDEAGF